MKKLFFILIYFYLNTSLFGQSKILNTYIEQGLSSNLSLKQEKLELEKALKGIEIAKSNLFPKIAFSPTYSLAAGGRRLEFPIGDLLNPVYSTLNKLTQSSNFPQVENVNQLLAPNNFHDTKFSIQYPIFNSDIKYNIALQKELVQTEYAKKKLLEFELRHSIEGAYIQFLQANEAIRVYQESLGLLNEVLNLNQKLVANQVALKDLVLIAENDLNKLNQQLQIALKNKDVAKAYFNFLINKPYNEEVLLDSLLIKNLPNSVILENLYESALENRPEFKQIESGIRVNEAAVLLQEKNARLPQLYVGANTGFQGFGYTFKNQAYGVLQMGLQLDLYHGYEKKHKIEQSKINKSILETKNEELKNQVKFQITQNYLELNSSLETYKNSQKPIETNIELLKILNSKFKNGNAIFLEVSKVQNDLMIAKISQTIAKYDTWIKYNNLKKVSASN
jgi:outer membrane protein